MVSKNLITLFFIYNFFSTLTLVVRVDLYNNVAAVKKQIGGEKMQSVLREIAKLRNGVPMIIDYHNSNRYRLVVKENDGMKTAYYFSAPIYNRRTRKIVDVKFQSNGGTVYSIGSNTNVTISTNVLMENAEGACSVSLPQKCNLISSQEANCGNVILMPTLNGVAAKCLVKGGEKISFFVEVGQPFLNIRANDKCFALMKERFRPFVVLSGIGSVDASGEIIAPVKIEYQKLTDKKYMITILPTTPLAHYVLYEVNLYENKLFQDTTVESMNPSVNNAFGSVGFIGNTSLYGEQWLYSRLDYSRISEIMDKRIHKIVMHLPKLNRSSVEMSAYKVEARFCSFGSTWDNKIPGKIPVSDSNINREYQSIDIISLLVDARTKTITHSEGLILKPKIKGKGFSVVSTGDSYYAPQILEVVYQ